MNENSRHHFGRKVFLDENGLPKYMRSTISSLFESSDKKSMLPLNKDISDVDLKGLLVDKKRSGSIGATKIDEFPVNKPLTNKELNESYHDQRIVPTGVRRFVEPSEGDSIFNNDNDIVRDRIGAYQSIKKMANSRNSTMEFDNPVERIRKS